MAKLSIKEQIAAARGRLLTDEGGMRAAISAYYLDGMKSAEWENRFGFPLKLAARVFSPATVADVCPACGSGMAQDYLPRQPKTTGALLSHTYCPACQHADQPTCRCTWCRERLVAFINDVLLSLNSRSSAVPAIEEASMRTRWVLRAYLEARQAQIPLAPEGQRGLWVSELIADGFADFALVSSQEAALDWYTVRANEAAVTGDINHLCQAARIEPRIADERAVLTQLRVLCAQDDPSHPVLKQLRNDWLHEQCLALIGQEIGHAEYPVEATSDALDIVISQVSAGVAFALSAGAVKYVHWLRKQQSWSHRAGNNRLPQTLRSFLANHITGAKPSRPFDIRDKSALTALLLPLDATCAPVATGQQVIDELALLRATVAKLGAQVETLTAQLGEQPATAPTQDSEPTPGTRIPLPRPPKPTSVTAQRPRPASRNRVSLAADRAPDHKKIRLKRVPQSAVQ